MTLLVLYGSAIKNRVSSGTSSFWYYWRYLETGISSSELLLLVEPNIRLCTYLSSYQQKCTASRELRNLIRTGGYVS
jgi:hypothetical protein